MARNVELKAGVDDLDAVEQKARELGVDPDNLIAEAYVDLLLTRH
ncbi:hypothetical protein [Saccharospirillum salsuginis]|uniref:Uncharacterized protein n=1 Tax=Saccharospirillum salsuginis TaxID=418750 RepID=A0A918KMQ4_9GAMM|nr:hypothetical protein [Saccharospirillum salsuginis]GGX67624.1 hypothetical protein GCM10007392_39080 [Saccharospirillum salsuginis]